MIGPRSRPARLALALALGWALGSAGACFDAPMPAVQFSCDPDDAPECPDGYTCEADGCCHRNGSNVEENLGKCQLAGALSASGTATVPTTEGSTGDASTSGTGTGSSTGDVTGITSEGSTAGSESSAGSTGANSGASTSGSTG